jgi:peptidoglycan/LPS O-acetylase OafA/YrhL
VSDSPPGAEGPVPGDDAPPPMPTSARVAVITMGLLAAVLILYAAITWLGREGLAEAVARAQPDLTQDEAARYVLVSALPYFLVGLALALAAWFLPKRRRWARWTGLAASFLLAALILLGMASVGGATPISLLVLVLAVAAGTSLAARTTREWMPRLRIGA